MYDYDRSGVTLRFDRRARDYQRVMIAFSREVADKAFRMISSVIELADEVLHSVTFNESISVHDDLKRIARDLGALARWIIGRREPEGEPIAQFTTLATDLTDLTKFWNRPAFLNKGDYQEKIAAIVKQMYEARKVVVQAFRRSGVWKINPSFAV